MLIKQFSKYLNNNFLFSAPPLAARLQGLAAAVAARFDHNLFTLLLVFSEWDVSPLSLPKSNATNTSLSPFSISCLQNFTISEPSWLG